MKKTSQTVGLITALLLAACQSGASDALKITDDHGNSPQHGGEWILVAGQVKGKTLNVQDGKITLKQDKDAFTGISAINHYRVPVKIRGNTIEHTDEPPTTTLMAGSMEAMRLESDYLEAMSAAKTLKREGDQLTISGDGIELQFRPAP